jgi:hypothetical protein
MSQIGLAAATELGPEGFLPATRLQAIGGFTPLLLHLPNHDPLWDAIDVLERYAATGERTWCSPPTAGSPATTPSRPNKGQLLIRPMSLRSSDTHARRATTAGTSPRRTPSSRRNPPMRARRRREHQRRVPADGDQQRRMNVGRGTASGCACQRHTWTTRSRTRTMPDGGRLLVTDRGRRQLGVSVRTVERLVAASRPDTRRKARLSTCASYPPTGLEGWAASDPVSPFHWFRAALHHSPARRTNGHTALTTVAHRFHLTGAICRAASTC